MANHDVYRTWAYQKMIEASSSNIWDGHWSCAALALVRLLEDQLVPSELEELVRRNLDRIVEEHPNAETYQADEAYEDFHPGLIDLLMRNSGSANALGHDVIYAYYMLDSLAVVEVPATAELFHAMTKLLNGFAEAGPGFVTVNGVNRVIHPDGVGATARRFRLDAGSVLDLFHSFSRSPRMEAGDMQLGHLLTHGHAIAELKPTTGHRNLDPLDDAYFTRIDILSHANALEAADGAAERERMNPADAGSPLEPTYWERALSDNRHGHYYKYAYSYLQLHRRAGRQPADYGSFSRIL